ncbi:uncharacterized protein LOC129308895 [Prosopis cineraria]|uniref:uncharacterized protein LOC129308895 n=1 Tax=Prosopis cineraria TaxID=364024 RepID=UPI00240F5D98|nr:uncharacterized protein LOC129308895 [Prosopis cineraria]
MNSDQGKVVWNSTLTEIFIKECLEQVYKKQRKGTTFNKNGWQSIIEEFEAKTGKRKISFMENLDIKTQIEDDDDEDVYDPAIDLREGSGDSEEELNLTDTAAPTGVTDELLGLNVTTNTSGTSGDGSQSKRKRVVGIGGRKKQKVPALMKIAYVISEMAKDNRARTETVNKILANDIGVSEVVVHLNELP